RLDANIDLTGALYVDPDMVILSWAPMGTSSQPFQGTLDGNGKAIENLDIVNWATDEEHGLIGVASGATVKNLSVSGRVRGKGMVGAIAGYASGGTRIEDCSAEVLIWTRSSVGV